jgi:hypothetical protein
VKTKSLLKIDTASVLSGTGWSVLVQGRPRYSEAGELIKVRNFRLGLALLVPMLGQRTGAQLDQFLPDIDAYYKLSSEVRVSF